MPHTPTNSASDAQDYQGTYQQFVDNPERFWLEQAKRVPWHTLPTQGISQTTPDSYRWYANGELNTCYMALDHHVLHGRAQQPALIYDSPVTGQQHVYSYQQLLEQVSVFAGALKQRGVAKGDRVVIYMPMIPQAAIAMLACARIGAIHSVVFGGFAPQELAVRIDDAQPKVILSASCGIEGQKVLPYKPLLDQALAKANHQPEHTIIYQRPQCQADLHSPRDLDWDILAAEGEATEPEVLNALDPLYILYTSGTTGKPKGVVRDNGGHAVAMHYSMETVYGMKPGEVFWAASDVGWVVGHSYIVYAPLMFGCTTIMYEGKPVGTPNPGAFWRVVQDHGVNALFTAPTAFRAIKKEDPNGEYFKKAQCQSLKKLFLAGERLDPPTLEWLETTTQLPVFDHWWQTETGWAIACNPVGIETLPVKPGSATVPTPGFEVTILDPQGNTCPSNTQGSVCVKLPLPPGCLPTVWQDDARFKQSYLKPYPGYYLTGDGGYLDEDGYLFVMGRMDDVINVAGHRLSTGEMEEVVASHSDVAECAVFAINDELKGQIPIGMVVLKDGVETQAEELEQALIQKVRDEIGPIACFKKALVVERLPKTRSGKILRRTLRQIMNGESYQVPSTIDDASILDDISDLVAAELL